MLLHMAAQVDRDIPVLFLDTGMLFGQTLDYRKQLAEHAGPDQRAATCARTPATLADQDPKTKLWQTSTDACCAHPQGAAARQGAAGLGRRLDHRPQALPRRRTRANLKVVEVERGRPDQVQPPGQLVARTSSTPMWPSTTCRPIRWSPTAIRRSAAGPAPSRSRRASDARSGRWAGSEKIECGIHTPPPSLTLRRSSWTR